MNRAAHEPDSGQAGSAGKAREADIRSLPAILAANDPRAPGLSGLEPDAAAQSIARIGRRLLADAAAPGSPVEPSRPATGPAPADMAMIADTIADLISRGAQARELVQPMIAPAEARRRAGLVTALLVGGALFTLTTRDSHAADAVRPDDVAVVVAALGLAGFRAATCPAALKPAAASPGGHDSHHRACGLRVGRDCTMS
ncbi:hypothetical protein ACFQ4K_27395 [Tistrella bauzanensis]